MYPVPRRVLYNIHAETRISSEPIKGFAILKSALSAAVNPNPTTISGNCCEVLFGSSLKNMWKLIFVGKLSQEQKADNELT